MPQVSGHPMAVFGAGQLLGQTKTRRLIGLLRTKGSRAIESGGMSEILEFFETALLRDPAGIFLK